MLHGCFLLGCHAVWAADPPALRARHAKPAKPPVSATTLEEVTVTAPRPGHSLASLGGSVVSQAELRRFERNRLADAIQLVPGATISDVGPRNEADIWIRGFDRWRVPLYEDGIPVYLPVDNRIDFARFDTADIAEIQVAKAYASVIDGPGALGGAINLVSRTVAKPFEAELRTGISADSTGSLQGVLTDSFIGTRQQNWFAQAAVSYIDQTHFRLPDGYSPGTYQKQGDRVDSYQQDYKINLKAGIIPNDTDAYTINLIDQVGDKGNPPPDEIVPPALQKTVKFWDWPAWDKQSVYGLTSTALDDAGSFIKSRVYYERFFNQLDSYDSIAYDTQNTPKSFNSTYNDQAAGGILELDEVLCDGCDTVRLSAQTRWDQHNETESTRNAPFATYYQEPWETANEITSSFAAENTWHPASEWDLTIGGSYDMRDMIGDSEFVTSGTKPRYGYSYAYPVENKYALNGEAALVYRLADGGTLHLTYADRARFPTLFEMYSTRFGTFVNNPDLQAERSRYVQAGWQDAVAGTSIGINVYYARVLNAIEAVALSPTISEDENVGTERHVGYEIALSRALLPSLSAGLNYSYLDRENLSGAVYATDTPRNKLFLYGTWDVTSAISLTPSLNIESSRLMQDAVNSELYYRGGAFALVNVKAAWKIRDGVTLEGGANNLTDETYLLTGGYHAPGRNYFMDVRLSI